MRNLPYHVYIGHAQLRLPLNTLTIFSIYFLYFFFHFTHCSLLLLARRRVRAIYVLFAFVFFPFFLGCWMERSSNKIGSDFVVAGEFIIETYIQRVEAAAASYEFHSFINARVICATKFVVRCGVPRCCWCCCDARGPTYHSYTSIGIAVEYSLEYRWNYLHFFFVAPLLLGHNAIILFVGLWDECVASVLRVKCTAVSLVLTHIVQCYVPLHYSGTWR